MATTRLPREAMKPVEAESMVLRHIALEAEKMATAKRTRDGNIIEAARRGYSYAAIGRAAGVSYQRVSQIVRGVR